MKSTWSVVAVYADLGAREAALHFCDRLVEKYWARCGFDVSWWPFESLADSESAAEAVGKAAEADIILFSATRDLPFHVLEWIEQWVRQRGEREGALVDLACTSGGSPAQSYLRDIAHRAGMDYLTQVPPSLEHAESPESCSQRAHERTRLLESILHRPARPPAEILFK